MDQIRYCNEINTEVGIADYFAGTPLFDEVKDEMLFFMDISYSF